MLRASETSRCRAEFQFIGIDFAEASHNTFIHYLMRFLGYAREDKNPIFSSTPLSC